jgi:Spy/CpxP family protein refolding chaperone
MMQMTQTTFRRMFGAFGGVRRAAAVIAIAAGTLGAASAASAQFGRGGFGGPDGVFSSPVTARDLDVYADVLNLSEDQREAADVLREGYQEAFQQEAQAMREQMEAAREEGGQGRGPGGWEGMREGFEALRESRRKAEESFHADLQSVLTPEQQERWPKAQREVRRERTIGRGLLSGERVDVVQITRDLIETMPEEERPALLEAVNPILDQYAVDVDRDLVARNETFEEGMSRAGELMASGDMEAMESLFEKGRQASDRVREVNQRYARQVEGVLPEAVRPAFQEQVKRASFPEVYRENYGKQVLDAVAGFSDLDETQKATVQAISEGYARDLAAANEQMTAAILEREKDMTVRDMFRRGRGGGMDDLNESRRELEAAAIESLKKVLTPEQIARLPERERERDRGGRDRGGQGGGERRERQRTF